jgi:predicted dithiol-disulfide oxidoreductase (DUF899 family)
LLCGADVFETYWTTIRGVEAMDNTYRLLDLTVSDGKRSGKILRRGG